MFVDIAKIKIAAGKGGDGSVSFHREKYVAAGGPDGGDGGKGGNIVFQVDDNLSTLIDFRYKRKYSADGGIPGSGKKSSGKNGKDLVIRVPRGTLVKDEKSGKILFDLSKDEPVVVAKGGRGGWGNSHFATPTRQTPKFAKPGLPGEEFDVVLELKLLADVGIIGFPNVGKSTLISVVSQARPKIANYHFTTLVPTLGVVRISENQSFVMTDIPGLIEGAGDGIGLGHEFLRHVERCRLLLHLVDVSGSEGRDPREDFDIINKELKAFNPEIVARPQMVVANKADLATEDQISEFQRYVEEKGFKFFAISAATGDGCKDLMYKVWEEIKTLPPIKEYIPDYIPEEVVKEKQKFDIIVENDVYIIDAQWLMPIVANMDMDDYESLQYFQRVLRSSGIIEELENKGINEGDTVRLFDFEFEYIR